MSPVADVPVLTAFDLDRTLIYSANAAGDPAALPALRIVEHYQGAPLSRITETAWTLLGDLAARAVFVPVTTRTQAQYERVHLPVAPGHAICANGGVLLTDGIRNRDWDDWAQATVAVAAPLDAVMALFAAVADASWVKTYRAAENLFCYLVAHSRAAIPTDWLAGFIEATTVMGWTVSVQGRKVYAVPAGLSKATGLSRLRALLAEQTGTPVPLLATGDSLLDAPMMLAADAAIRPAHGELHEQGWTHPDVAVTTATGALAGEEIIRWMLTHTRSREQVA